MTFPYNAEDSLNVLGKIPWALMPNHFHLLLRTALVPISTVMRRLLTGHAVYYNRRHRRNGHLFQNRYKSILCQEDTYLLELVRYIHLNPLRAKLVKDMNALGNHRFSGHDVILGKFSHSWQLIDKVLSFLGEKTWIASRKYKSFVARGIDMGKRTDLTGGGMIRCSGGWDAVKTMKSANIQIKGDERILGMELLLKRSY